MVNPLGNGGSTRLGTGLKRRSHGADWGGGGGDLLTWLLIFSFWRMNDQKKTRNKKRKIETTGSCGDDDLRPFAGMFPF